MIDPLLSRRELLHRCGMGMGAVALNGLLADAGLLHAAEPTTGRQLLAPKQPHFAPKAKHVIHIFINGGPSHIDTFDPKPLLKKYEGRSLPVENFATERATGAAFPSPFKFRKYGESGLEVSELFEQTARCADDITVIRSMHTDIPNHEPSLLLMNCGDARIPRPSMGSWINYGLGTENQNLPGFVVMCPGGVPTQGNENWRSAFLPADYQGMYIDTQHEKPEDLITNIRNPRADRTQQRRQLDLLLALNEDHGKTRGRDPEMEARIASFELAYRMQLEATEAFDVSREPKHILDMYGPGPQARQLLIARRLVERGVRFVQLWHGAGQPWDNHEDIMVHQRLAKECDQAIGALLQDLKQRGLLNETLVIWGGEFGRTPTVELPNTLSGNPKEMQMGRDHNHYGFTTWLAGGGVKGGYVHGSTDEFGWKATEKPVHVHDLHATILHLMGFDHEKLTYRHAGRDFRLTDVHGSVVTDLLA